MVQKFEKFGRYYLVCEDCHQFLDNEKFRIRFECPCGGGVQTILESQLESQINKIRLNKIKIINGQI